MRNAIVLVILAVQVSAFAADFNPLVVWLFSRTELGANRIGIVQSLLATGRPHNINPYDYLVDVPQRVGRHSASLLHQLTLRIWKGMFAKNPLGPDLHNLEGRRADAVA